jgi:hypothetical protein
MHKRKRQLEFIDRGFGFPVRLKNVPMIQLRGIWTPDINYNALADAVLRALCFKPARLTGNEVHFVRLHHGFTLEQFGEQFGVSHPAVMKWERAGEAPTGMQWSTEKDLRLWLFLQIDHKRSAREFMSVYQCLDQHVAKRAEPLADTTIFSWSGKKLVAKPCARGRSSAARVG